MKNIHIFGHITVRVHSSTFVKSHFTCINAKICHNKIFCGVGSRKGTAISCLLVYICIPIMMRFDGVMIAIHHNILCNTKYLAPNFQQQNLIIKRKIWTENVAFVKVNDEDLINNFFSRTRIFIYE